MRSLLGFFAAHPRSCAMISISFVFSPPWTGSICLYKEKPPFVRSKQTCPCISGPDTLHASTNLSKRFSPDLAGSLRCGRGVVLLCHDDFFRLNKYPQRFTFKLIIFLARDKASSSLVNKSLPWESFKSMVLNDREFLNRFHDGSLDGFHHQDHLRLA